MNSGYPTSNIYGNNINFYATYNLWTSNDNGNTWIPVTNYYLSGSLTAFSLAVSGDIFYCCVSDNGMYQACYSNTYGKIFYSNNYGVSWYIFNNPKTGLSSFYITNSGVFIITVIVSTTGTIYTTSDFGLNYNELIILR